MSLPPDSYRDCESPERMGAFVLYQLSDQNANNVAGSNTQLDIHDIPAGSYFLEINAGANKFEIITLMVK